MNLSKLVSSANRFLFNQSIGNHWRCQFVDGSQHVELSQLHLVQSISNCLPMVVFMLSKRPIDLVKTQASISRLIRHRAVMGSFKGILLVDSVSVHSVTRCSLLPPRRPLPILQPLNHNLPPFSPSPSFDLENLPRTPHLLSLSGSFHPRTRTKAQFRQAYKVFLYDCGKCGTSILVHSCSVPTHPSLIPELCRWIPHVPFPKPIQTPSAAQLG